MLHNTLWNIDLKQKQQQTHFIMDNFVSQGVMFPFFGWGGGGICEMRKSKSAVGN